MMPTKYQTFSELYPIFLEALNNQDYETVRNIFSSYQFDHKRIKIMMWLTHLLIPEQIVSLYRSINSRMLWKKFISHIQSFAPTS